MARVRGSLIVSLTKSYYDYVKNAGAAFRIGLNMSSFTLLSGASCSSSSIPGCIDSSYNGQFTTGSFTATFSASFTPSSDATLTSLGMAVLKPGISWVYQLGTIDMSNLSVQLTGGTAYSISFEHKITYPLTI